ncbi:MAG: O-antigen ligase family protein [Candidatus Kapabacteria bacterium]|nr:O-antigen ligase family protein [Candidatus Kapabacteria bacterium]
MQAILLIIFIAHFAFGFQLFAVGTFGITALEVAVLLFYCVFFVKVLRENCKFSIPRHALPAVLGVFIVSVILSGVSLMTSFASAEIIQFFKTFIHLIFLMLLTVLGVSYEFDKKLIDNIFKLWLILSLPINIFGIYQIFARAFDLPLAWLEYTNVTLALRGSTDAEDVVKQLSLQFGNFFRATSVFSEPSALAAFNLNVFILCIIPYVQKAKPLIKSKFLLISIFVFCVAGLFLTFSLTGVLGCALILLSILFLEAKKVRIRILKIIIAGIILLIPADLLIEDYTETSVFELFSQRITGILGGNDRMASDGIDGESFATRAGAFGKSFDIWKTSPIFGVGIGLTQYNKEVDLNFSEFTIMAVLSELGIIGTVAFIAFFVLLFKITLQMRRHVARNALPDPSLARQYGLVYYLLLIQFEINFITSNHLVAANLWIHILLVLIPVANYLRQKYGAITFTIFDKSFRDKYLR